MPLQVHVLSGSSHASCVAQWQLPVQLGESVAAAEMETPTPLACAPGEQQRVLHFEQTMEQWLAVDISVALGTAPVPRPKPAAQAAPVQMADAAEIE